MTNDIALRRLAKMPIIAILRGISVSEVDAVSDTLVQAGVTCMEVTLNTPGWQECISRLHRRHGSNILLGAGTVLHPEQVAEVQKYGGRIIISPNMNTDVIKATKELDLISAPGCFTPTECFAALHAGADILKLFPAEALGLPFIKAISAVLPGGVRICPTGGVGVSNIAGFVAAGVIAVGVGSSLYKKGKLIEELHQAANKLVAQAKVGQLQL